MIKQSVKATSDLLISRERRRKALAGKRSEKDKINLMMLSCIYNGQETLRSCGRALGFIALQTALRVPASLFHGMLHIDTADLACDKNKHHERAAMWVLPHFVKVALANELNSSM